MTAAQPDDGLRDAITSALGRPRLPSRRRPGSVPSSRSLGYARRQARLPVLQATASVDGRSLAAWCPWCAQTHIHDRHQACQAGTCGCRRHEPGCPPRRHCTCAPGAGDGPRTPRGRQVPLCLTGSPLAAVGYYIMEVPR